jgi:hypothetical protein
MTFADYLREVTKQKVAHTDWRMGQTYFNVLHAHRPTIANNMPKTLDPFYDDALVPYFLEYVEAMW